jgi:NAD(P)-dependent dehydrogenase (short-subunit alcohol dehydrogenase family)
MGARLLFNQRENKHRKRKHMSNNNGQKLAGKVAVVTGGSRGIGAAIAKRLATDGVSVAITYTKGADAAALVIKEIERTGGKAIAIQADAADSKAVKAAIEKTVATFGRLDVLVNNAGTAIPKTFEETTLEEMDHVIDINPWRLCRDASGAETPAGRGSHHHDRLSRGRACLDARLGALRGNKRGREDFHTRVSQRGRKPRHYGQ